jgi:hypothetical protein
MIIFARGAAPGAGAGHSASAAAASPRVVMTADPGR